MKARFLLVVVLSGCSDGREASLDDLTIGCKPLEGRPRFETSADFAPAVPGTLRGWNPDGRWFLTGVRVGGVSSYHFARDGARVVIDRNGAAPGTIDDTELFARAETTGASGAGVVVATRISNLAPDGTARAERATCGESGCTVCTARLVRATHNADEG
ncbi:MAG TPA: hypothetical protein VFK02_03825, partial [Kofleriaceae bacterium]|nr:hypothetical protein [Kofleriaceae bacterium]